MNELETIRNEIDRIDGNIIDMLAKRNDAIKKIAHYKREHGLPAEDMARFVAMMDERHDRAEKVWISTALIDQIFTILHDYSLKVQEPIIVENE